MSGDLSGGSRERRGEEGELSEGGRVKLANPE